MARNASAQLGTSNASSENLEWLLALAEGHAGHEVGHDAYVELLLDVGATAESGRGECMVALRYPSEFGGIEAPAA
jgi:hypothetical protein